MKDNMNIQNKVFEQYSTSFEKVLMNKGLALSPPHVFKKVLNIQLLFLLNYM